MSCNIFLFVLGSKVIFGRLSDGVCAHGLGGPESVPPRIHVTVGQGVRVRLLGRLLVRLVLVVTVDYLFWIDHILRLEVGVLGGEHVDRGCGWLRYGLGRSAARHCTRSVFLKRFFF